ncbi:MAG: conjugal transfer protein TraL [Oscillospiraceae bacterium]|jgi:Gpi18-like mannosyltransferase|nr:conjugal transfer protein TraL [Oscillospiraceae bacterium]
MESNPNETYFSGARRGGVWLTVGLALAAPGLFFLAMEPYALGAGATDRAATLALFTLLFWGALALLYRGWGVRAPVELYAAAGALLLIALFLRVRCLDVVTPDYRDFLRPWVEEFRQNGGFAALAKIRSDYNVPYLYLLAGLSYLPIDDMLLIKLTSVVADLLLVWTAVSLSRYWGLARTKKLLLFALLLFAPTLWLNSAAWAQCDALYTLFALQCFLQARRGRPWLAVALAAVGFAFKLQIIFFLPMLAVFWMSKRVSFKHLLAFPVTYLAVCLPALLLGRPFEKLFTIYVQQVGQYSGYLTLSAPTVYAFLPDEPHNLLSALGIAAAAVFVLAVLGAALRRRALDDQLLLTLALLFCAGLPWLLPSMHERYFYMADVLAVCYAVARPRRWFVAPLMLYASYAGYHAYLVREWLPIRPLGMGLPAVAAAAVAGVALYDFYTSGRRQSVQKS